MTRSLRQILLLVGLVYSCATTKSQLDIARVQAQEAEKAAELLHSSSIFKIRYNPAPCRCTPYEVFAQNRWYRLRISGDTSLLKALEDRIGARAAQPPVVLTVHGKVGGVTRCRCGVHCIELELQEGKR